MSNNEKGITAARKQLRFPYVQVWEAPAMHELTWYLPQFSQVIMMILLHKQETRKQGTRRI